MGLLSHYSKLSILRNSYLDLLKIRERPALDLLKVVRRTTATHTSPDVRERVLEEYTAGVLVDEIAINYDISRDTINQIVHAAGAPLRFLGLRQEQVSEAAQRYEDGESLAALGRRFGVDPMTVRSYLLKAGVKIRARNGWPAQPQSAAGSR